MIALQEISNHLSQVDGPVADLRKLPVDDNELRAILDDVRRHENAEGVSV